MKLRTTKNSIRIRVRKSEIAALQKNGVVEESIQFSTQVVFKFALKISEDADQLAATLQNNYLVLTLPKKKVVQWFNTNQVEMETNIPLDHEERLHLLVEKDFPCLDRPNEDKSDTFWELAPEEPENC